jgi:hypothetical protein
MSKSQLKRHAIQMRNTEKSYVVAITDNSAVIAKLEADKARLIEALIKIEFEYDYTLDDDMTKAVTDGYALALKMKGEQ